jgi:hypothetical protein
MKKNIIFKLTIPFLFSTIMSCGQTSPKKPPVKTTPVALGKIFQPSYPEKKGIVPNTNPALDYSILNDVITIMEWHFEMRFTPAERAEYENILIEEWNKNEKGNERENIKSFTTYLQTLKQKSNFDIFMEQSSVTSADIMDCGMEGILGNDWKPTSLRGGIKKQAGEGNKECIFLWNKIINYEKPVAEGKVFVSKFTQKYIDAAAEWIAFKINVVADKELIVLDETKREQMKKMILDAWSKEKSNQKSEYEYGNVQAMLSEASTNWNTLRLTKVYSMDKYITNYNKLSTLADWAKQAVYYCPAVKPYAEQRLKELNDYAAKMNDTEWQLEFQRLNMQANMNNQVFQQMKKDMLHSHVQMLNIIEGYDKWEVKETRPY